MLRTCEEMKEKGFVIIPFPSSIKDVMLKHIQGYVAEVTRSSEDNLTAAVMRLSDEEFSSFLGAKPFRMFPDEVSRILAHWVATLSPLIGGARAGINYVNAYERKTNPRLRPDSYDVFWRCVRPGKGDVGAPHADYQFWELAKGTDDEAGIPFEYDERWKIWIPLLGCENINSLQVIPGSHAEEVPVTISSTKNGLRPSLDSTWLKENEKRFICPFQNFTDCCVLFHDKLVHKGPPNQASHLRISADLTILLKLALEAALV